MEIFTSKILPDPSPKVQKIPTSPLAHKLKVTNPIDLGFDWVTFPDLEKQQ